MISNFCYLKFDSNAGFYRSVCTSILNKKEIELIKETVIEDNVQSGDIVYKNPNFYQIINIRQSELKSYYKSLLSNSGIILSNTLSPEKATLFVETSDNISKLHDIKKTVKDFNDNNYSYFKKISYDNFIKTKDEYSDFSFVIDDFDYGKSAPEIFEDKYVTNGYFYILIEPNADVIFEEYVVLKGFLTISEKDLFSYTIMISNLLKSVYSPRVISITNFCKNVMNRKKSISYDEFIQIQSYKGTEYADTVNMLLKSYDEDFILENFDSDPDSVIYLKILQNDYKYNSITIIRTLESAYNKNKDYLIDRYLLFINQTNALDYLDEIIIIPDLIEFKRITYFNWDKSTIYKNMYEQIPKSCAETG